MEGERPVNVPHSERALAFATLTGRHLDESYRLASLILADPVEAEDATHDAVVAAWRRFDQLRDKGRFEPWFQRILVNVCRDRVRHRRRHSVRDLTVAAELRNAGEDRNLADRDEIGRAFRSLTVDHRAVLVLRFYRDLSVDEIAAQLGIPAGTVKSRLHHALQSLGVVIRAARVGESER